MEEREINTLKSEHLNEGVKPIIFCVGTIQDFQNDPGPVRKIDRPGDDENIANVDYWAKHKKLISENFKNAKYQSYVISPADEKNKISKSYRDCTGVVLSGIDKETNKAISILTHQDPTYFLADESHANKFFSDLEERVIELKKRCVPGTIDAGIFGGNYAVSDKYDDRWDDEASNEQFRENHYDSITSISDELFDMLGFEPVIFTGPKTNTEGDSNDDVFFDNENRRLYIVRPEVGNVTTESYLPSDVNKQSKKWEDEWEASRLVTVREEEMQRLKNEAEDKKKTETLYAKIMSTFFSKKK